MIQREPFAGFNKRESPWFWELLESAGRGLTEKPYRHQNAELSEAARHTAKAVKCLYEAAAHLQKAYPLSGCFTEYLQQVNPDDIEAAAGVLGELIEPMQERGKLSQKDTQAHISECVHKLVFAYYHGTGNPPRFSRKALETAGEGQKIVPGSFTDFVSRFFDEIETNTTLSAFAAMVERVTRDARNGVPPIDELPPIDEPQTHQPLYSQLPE